MNMKKFFDVRHLCICMILSNSPAFSMDSENTFSKNPDPQIARSITLHYLQEGEPNEAEEYLSELLETDSHNAEAWRLLGLVHFRMKNWPEATASFKLAAYFTSGTEKGVNLYYLADSQTMENDLKGANATIDELAANPDFSEATKTAREYSAQGKQFPELDTDKGFHPSTPTHSGSRFAINITGGHDSNVLLLSYPNITPGVTTASWFIKPSVFTQVPFGASGLVLEASSIYTHNYSKGAQLYDNVVASLALEYRMTNPTAEKLGFAFYVSEDFAWYNVDGMRPLSMGETLGWRAVPFRGEKWSLGFNLPVSYIQYPKPFNPNPKYNPDGIVTSPSITLKHLLFSTVFTEMLTLGKQYAKGSNLHSEWIEGTFGFLKEFVPHRLSFEGNLDLLRAIYRGSNPNRNDQTVSADLDFNIGIKEINSALKLSAAYMRNDSTLQVANYKKYVFSLGVTYDAF